MPQFSFIFQVSIKHFVCFHPFFILSSILFLSRVVGTDKNILPKKPLLAIENGLKGSPDAEQKQACFLRVAEEEKLGVLFDIYLPVCFFG